LIKERNKGGVLEGTQYAKDRKEETFSNSICEKLRHLWINGSSSPDRSILDFGLKKIATEFTESTERIQTAADKSDKTAECANEHKGKQFPVSPTSR
jgi:hypothetical protein